MRLRSRKASHTRTVSVEPGVPWSLHLFHCTREPTGHSRGYLELLIRFCPLNVPRTSVHKTNKKTTFIQLFLMTISTCSSGYHLVGRFSFLSKIMESAITFENSLLPSCLTTYFVFHSIFIELKFVT